MALRLRLEPVKAKGGLVTGCKLELTTKGSGDLPADGKHELSIVFYELASKGDVAREDRKLATLTGELTVEGGKLKGFRVPGGLREEPLFRHSDFWVDLHYPESYQAYGAPQLRLPWEVAEEGEKLELGAALELGGEVIAAASLNKPVDIPLKHEKVPDDGDPKSKKTFTFYGVEAVYPAGNELGDSLHMRIGEKPLNIFLHDAIQSHFELDLDLLRRKLQETFGSGGFKNVKVELKSGEEAKDSGLWKQQDGRWAAKGMKTAPDVWLAKGTSDASEGTVHPFFDFWVFYERSIVPTLGELGQGELLNLEARYDEAKGTKRVMLPTALVGNLMDGWLGQAEDADNKHNLLVATIAHEIGHGLGLRHALRFDGKGYEKLANGLGVMSQMGLQGGEIPLKRFSPVERATVERHYLR